jgi:hypothetical protein
MKAIMKRGKVERQRHIGKKEVRKDDIRKKKPFASAYGIKS